jgi:hypothetical protein
MDVARAPEGRLVPTPVMDALRDILAKLPAAELPAATAVALAWSLAGGPDLAGRARCLGLQHGVLQLQAENAEAMRRIASVEAEVRSAMNRMLGGETVRRVRCVL